MLLAVVPLTIVQSLQQQETRQRAEQPLILTASSDKSSYDIRDEVNVNIDLENPNQKDISAIDTIITYDKNLLEFVSLGAGDFVVITPENSQIQNNPGSIHLVGIRMETRVSPQLRVTTLKLRALEKTGEANISFSNATITASGQSGLISPEMEPKTISITKDEFKECVYGRIRNGDAENIAKNICENIQNANGNNNGQSSVPPQSTAQTVKTDQRCADFDPQGFATCKTPPNGNMSCWLPFCSADKYCAYTLNPLTQNDSKCSSLWASSNTTAPASAAIPTATPTPTPAPTAAPTPTPSYDFGGGDND